MNRKAGAQNHAELLIQSVTDYAIYMLDPGGLVVSWNAGAQRFKGYAVEEILGQHFSVFYTDEDRENGMPEKALDAALNQGHFEAEAWRVRKDGSQFWANVVIDPIWDEDGVHIGFAKVTRDLTERRDLQRALDQSREQFFQAQKMEAIGQLTGGVAHDFNNILAAIIGSIGIAQGRLAKGEGIGVFLDNALRAAERGQTLTQRMLAFARKQELRLEPVDMVRSVREMAELLARTIGANIAIMTQFPLRLPMALADRTQLELALMNLIVNARDAMPGGGTIVIAGDEVLEDGARFVRLIVEDQGTGMDPETLRRAAEPFFTTKGVGKGTGLGLSMVQGMIEQCGGRFVLESERDSGARAELWLPVSEGHSDAVQSSQQSEDVPPALRPLHILAVDDDPIVLLNTLTILEDAGHHVFEAHSGRSALGVLADHEVDLLITDFAMPGMTGAELVEAARSVRPNLKAIIASGYADLPDGKALLVPRLAKPFTDRELVDLVASVAG